MKMHRVAVAPVAALSLITGSLALSPSVRAAAANVAATMIEVEGEGAKYWTRWRGPSGQGIVKTGKYRDTWSPTEGIKWKSAVPGRGHSSPIVWGDHIFLTTEYDDGARLSMLAFRRSDGKQLWETFVPTDGIEHVYPKNSRASATPATDGKLVYASFGTHGLAAFDFKGKMVWHTPVGRLNNYHGTAGSPILYKDRLFIYQDHKGGGDTPSFVAAFDKNTGKQIWKTPRTEQTGWGTPVVIRAGDRDELIVSSSRRVAAYDPDSGKELWTVSGLTFEVIPTPVVAEGLATAEAERLGELPELNTRFHRLLADAADNEFLEEIMNRLSHLIEWVYAARIRERSARSWHEHSLIVDAVALGDADEAERCAFHHITNARAAYHFIQPPADRA